MKTTSQILRNVITACILPLGISSFAQSIIEDVSVETYYVSDANDATTEVGGFLEEGSVTYRVYVDLVEGAQIKAMYGDSNHVFEIYSNENFFNNNDRGETWGFDIPDNKLDENTVALDSWLTFGGATDEHWGVPKELDIDGSEIGGDDHEDGLLVNNTAEMGIALTEADGLLGTEDTSPSNFFVFGDDPYGAFGDSTATNMFSTHDFTTTMDESGLDSLENRFLVAQLTTKGDLNFCLNFQIIDPDGNLVYYVATGDTLLEGEVLSPLLKYPPQCGCTDPNFLEFDPNAACDDGTCSTEIIFGCMDEEACNYDPEVNFNVQELCCILPDNCDGLDPDLICPGFVGVEEMESQGIAINVFPNPFSEKLTIEITSSSSIQTGAWKMVNAVGEVVQKGNVESSNELTQLEIDAQYLERGMYVLRLNFGDQIISARVLKM